VDYREGSPFGIACAHIKTQQVLPILQECHCAVISKRRKLGRYNYLIKPLLQSNRHALAFLAMPRL
jgi:hypothetical protein